MGIAGIGPTGNEIAERLVTLCREAKWEAAQTELFADDAVSIETQSTAFAKETKGLPAIFGKGRVFDGMIEAMHALSVSDGVVAEHSFACTMSIDVTMKGQGRMKMSELCVYLVKDEKIISEQFYA